MSTFELVVTDREGGIHQDGAWLWGHSQTFEMPGLNNWRIGQRILRGGLSEGVAVVDIEIDDFSLLVLPTRGMGIWRAESRGKTLGWNSPVRMPVHPAFVDQGDRGGLGWLHGFNELLCRCGLAWMGPPGDDRGQPLTLHGRIANLPANYVKLVATNDHGGQLSVTGIVDECSMFGSCLRLTSTLTITAGKPGWSIVDEVTNLGGQPADMSLLYHINVGQPYLGPESRTRIPYRAVAPRDARAADGIDQLETYLPPTPGYAEQVYFYSPCSAADGWSLAVLEQPALESALAVRFRATTLPWLTVWKCTQATADGYVTGIEPGTNLPNFRSFERDQQRLPQLMPGESRTHELRFDLAHGSAAIAQLNSEVEQLQEVAHPQRHRKPHPGWSPGA
jgi:galactose mutarotase-like enzyme